MSRPTLSEWIARRGASNVARGLGSIGIPVSPQAVHAWMAGRARPRPQCAAALVQLSRGALTITRIYGGQAAPAPGETER